MPELKVNIMSNLFRISSTEIQNQYQTMLNDLNTEIAAYQTTGMNNDAIYNALLSDFENEAGVFQRFGGGIERVMDGLVTRTTQSEQVSNNPLEQKYNWILDPTVEKHCDDCLERADMGSLTMLEWGSMGIPGSGVTSCGDYCHCLLETAEVLVESN